MGSPCRINSPDQEKRQLKQNDMCCNAGTVNAENACGKEIGIFQVI